MHNFKFYVVYPSVGGYIFLDRDWLNPGDKLYFGETQVKILEKLVFSETVTRYGIDQMLSTDCGNTFTFYKETNEIPNNPNITVNIYINLLSN